MDCSTVHSDTQATMTSSLKNVTTVSAEAGSSVQSIRCSLDADAMSAKQPQPSVSTKQSTW